MPRQAQPLATPVLSQWDLLMECKCTSDDSRLGCNASAGSLAQSHHQASVALREIIKTCPADKRESALRKGVDLGLQHALPSLILILGMQQPSWSRMRSAARHRASKVSKG